MASNSVLLDTTYRTSEFSRQIATNSTPIRHRHHSSSTADNHQLSDTTLRRHHSSSTADNHHSSDTIIMPYHVVTSKPSVTPVESSTRRDMMPFDPDPTQSHHLPAKSDRVIVVQGMFLLSAWRNWWINRIEWAPTCNAVYLYFYMTYHIVAINLQVR